ncbi:MAG: efflux RND transporter permease subunit [Verrucomicrobiota bacterium]|nr:efflux RND transporter permease subunit [Verrucomicrobiota bacterium]
MIRWFTSNGVAANLLAAIVVVAGLFTATSIKLELFPELDLDIVNIGVAYPGAAPEEVESGIVELIEDRIQDLDGIKRLRATSTEGYGAVTIEVERGFDARELRDKVKARIDAITNFPEQAEEANVEEALIRNEVISLAIYGDSDVRTLKNISEFTRDELNVRAGISQVELNGAPQYEISINLSEQSLREYGLTFDFIVQTIRNNSVDIPGGAIKSKGGEILVRTAAKAYTGSEFERIPVLVKPDGTLVTLSDVATIDDGYIDVPLITKFNGQRAVLINIYALGDESALDVAHRVREFAEDLQSELPLGITIEPFRDFTYYLKGRLQMLIENGVFGLLLVFLVLTLFLRPSLAFFVMLGIPISFLGAMLFLPFLGISINLASLFGFILVLGIVVDDAIIVGESIFTQFQKHGGPGVNASVAGTKRVAIPVTFAVLTTIVAFIPVLTIPGFLGKFFYPIPVVVIATLIWSLIESKLVLPYHLTLCNVGAGRRHTMNWLSRKQRTIADSLEYFIENHYRPLLSKAIEMRYATVALFVGILMIMAGMLLGKHMPFVFFPSVPSDYIVAQLVMPEGTPVELTEDAIAKMHDGLEDLRKEVREQGYGEPFDNVVITIGSQPFAASGGPMGSITKTVSTNKAEIAVELIKREDLADGGNIKELSAPNLANRWRALIGPIAGVKELSFNADAAGQAGSAIDVQLTGRDFNKLREASAVIQSKLATYEGLFDIRDNYSSGKREIKLALKPSAQNLGLQQSDLGSQVRAAFYGVEAQRIQRGRDDIKVMVRYPKNERASVENLEELRIRTPNGDAIPFEAVADFEIASGFSTINRIDRRRVLNITADADKDVANLELVKSDLVGKKGKGGYMDDLLESYPGVAWSFEGEAREQSDIFKSLGRMSVIAAFIIYALLAVPLRSYLQPFIVMFVIPFGLIGAILGHWIMGQSMSILSILGFVALAGVVVNDSLVLVDFINNERENGAPIRKAIESAGAKRFRPIILTSLTTFVGLLPLLFETSLQAQFLIPMATSLSFGVLFATFMTLLLVPAFYNILEDLKDFVRRFIKRGEIEINLHN